MRYLIVLMLLLTGCAGVNDSLTPSMRVTKDNFDGSTIVYQPDVSSASSLSEPFHTLGFEWVSRTPEVVYVTAGVTGVKNIYGLAFNSDGKVIERINTASEHTELGQRSTRRFGMSWGDFVSVANGKDVKMRVSMGNTYSVSSFGSATSATINPKFAPFIEKVRELRAASGRH
jgi:hypothetical protein